MDIVAILSAGIPWPLIFMVVIAIIGGVQWLKGVFKKAASWVWAIAALAMCFGFMALAVLVSVWILYALVAFALIQLCYELFLQGVPMLVKKAFNLPTETPEVPKTDKPGQ